MLILMHDKMGQKGSAFASASKRRLPGIVFRTSNGAAIDVDPDDAEDTIALVERGGITVEYNEQELPPEAGAHFKKASINKWGHGRERIRTKDEKYTNHERRQPERI